MIRLEVHELARVIGGGRTNALKSLVLTAGNLAKHEIGDLERIAQSWLGDVERGSKEWRRVTDITTFHLRRVPGNKKPEVRIDTPKSF
jgi:hypothetical protein